jgi:hypothetical protein
LSNPAIPQRLLQIDELIKADHNLSEEDLCFHLWEYVKEGGFAEYPTNQLIKNLQIPMSIKGDPYRWKYKIAALKFCTDALGAVVPRAFFSEYTWVPVPPSVVKSDAAYDPRLHYVLRKVAPAIPDLRELVLQRENGTSKQKGISAEERARNYLIADDIVDPAPSRIIVFDDVIAGGTHFKAMKMVLQERFPGIEVTGLFLARTIRPKDPEIQVDLESVKKGVFKLKL